MACDSCWSYGQGVDTLSKKIARLRSGALLGQAGDNDARDVIALLTNIKSPRQLPSRTALLELRQDFLGLMVFPEGQIVKIATSIVPPTNWTPDTEVDDIGVWEIGFSHAAIGSGADFATGAMEAGATARKAVEIACRRDLNSRPPIHSFALKGR